MKLIYIGDHFYLESGTMMSAIYHETGERSDWGKVNCSLRSGEDVEIRQATPMEREFYNAQLESIKREKRQKATSA